MTPPSWHERDDERVPFVFHSRRSSLLYPLCTPPHLLTSTHPMSDEKNKLYYADNLQVLRANYPKLQLKA